jgi:hypothetical protein
VGEIGTSLTCYIQLLEFRGMPKQMVVDPKEGTVLKCSIKKVTPELGPKKKIEFNRQKWR